MAANPDVASHQRSVTRVLDLLDALQQAPDGLPLGALIQIAGVPKSTTLRYLGTLIDRRYVERDAVTGEYRLGLGAPSQAQFYARLARVARPSMERLRDSIRETVTYGVLDRDGVVFLDVVESPQLIRLNAHLGDRSPLHSSAIGKAIAATLPDDQVARIVEHVGLVRRTERTITSVDDLLADLHEVRRRGYAISNGENDLDACAVAASLPTPRLHAALGVTAPAMRFSLEDAHAVGPALRREAEAVAAQLPG